MVEALPPRIVFEILARLENSLGKGPFVGDMDNFYDNLAMLYSMCNYSLK